MRVASSAAALLDGARIHVVAAHSDDETLGCGGLLALASGRSEVRVSVLADGVSSRFPTPEDAALMIVDREERAVAALARLGVDDVRFHRLRDNAMDSYPLLEVVRAIESDAEGFRADVVLLPWTGDLNIDHELASRAGLTAYRPLPGSTASLVLMYEILSSTGLRGGDVAGSFAPSLSVDISGALDAKLEALAAYGDEVPRSPHPRAREAVAALAAHRGHAVGVGAAEAFIVARWRL